MEHASLLTLCEYCFSRIRYGPTYTPCLVVAGGKRYGGRGYSLRGVASLDSLAGLIQLGNNCELAPLLMTGRRGDFLH